MTHENKPAEQMTNTDWLNTFLDLRAQFVRDYEQAKCKNPQATFTHMHLFSKIVACDKKIKELQRRIKNGDL